MELAKADTFEKRSFPLSSVKLQEFNSSQKSATPDPHMPSGFTPYLDFLVLLHQLPWSKWGESPITSTFTLLKPLCPQSVQNPLLLYLTFYPLEVTSSLSTFCIWKFISFIFHFKILYVSLWDKTLYFEILSLIQKNICKIFNVQLKGRDWGFLISTKYALY